MELSDILVGRKRQIEMLDSIMDSREAEFVVVYGRRRVGKTFLVNAYFNDSYTFKLTGLARKGKQDQLANFKISMNRYGDVKYTKPRSWLEAFEQLRSLLEKHKTASGKRVIFIDELPWMDSRGSNLITAIEHFWNDWACTQQDIVLIVCGSATSWITKKLLKNHGGLHNRVTQKIYLSPFNLAECREYLESRGILMDYKSITESYMIMGGIPYYLKHIKRGKSLAQNIDEMFFLDKGSLDGEFDALYSSLFTQSESYIKVVEALSSKNKGLTRSEILDAVRMKSNGHFSTIMKNLIDCEFVRRYKGYGKTSKMSLYQLIDPFTLFYFKYIRKYGTSDKPFWQFQTDTRTHDTWAGIAFEQLCLNHHAQIEKGLGISGITTRVFSWTGAAEEKAQIDLIIRRSDGIINVCEMKYYDEDYSVDKKGLTDIQRRIGIFKESNSPKEAIHPVLVTTYGLKRNAYSDVFQNVITLKDLFQYE